MSNPFERLDAAISASCERAFGDVAVITPKTVQQYTGAETDLSRPEKTVKGIYSSAPETEALGGKGRQGMQGMTNVSGQTATFWMSEATVAALGYDLRPGDRIVIQGRGGGTFRISALHPTNLGDLELSLTIDGVSA